MKHNFAKTDNMDAWLRHPVLGDPSFDTFERLDKSVHISSPPYEWAVNGSLFCDFDGSWYCYAGLYPRGYATTSITRFKIYRSRDNGASWEDLGWGFEEGFSFEGFDTPFDVCPDAYVTYDKKLKKYLLTYDTAPNNFTWETAFDPNSGADGGVGVALADSPAGPFKRLPNLVISNKQVHGLFGIYSRIYASCVIPRGDDYIAFCLADSDRHFSWALTVVTAPSLDGPWSVPHVVLGCDRPEYYPCPMEFFPVELCGDNVIAKATSVAMNRNYQVSFSAPLEQAHDPAAWKMTDDGNIWHAHDHHDEHYGIWGQTINGFVKDGKYVVMHPSRNTEDLGTLGLAIRDTDTPHSDGFTMTAHAGPSVSLLKTAYKDFSLHAEFMFKGQIDICFAYKGILGPHSSTSDAMPSSSALADYSAVRLIDGACSLISVSSDGSIVTHASIPISDTQISLELDRTQDGCVSASVNGNMLCKSVSLDSITSSVGIVLDRFSRIECSELVIDGDMLPYEWEWNTEDALLGAGQLFPDPDIKTPDDDLAPDVWHRMRDGYVGEGKIRAKWNLHGNGFIIKLFRNTTFGSANILVDGVLHGCIDLCGTGIAEYPVNALKQGAHSITVEPKNGRIAILGITVNGKTDK